MNTKLANLLFEENNIKNISKIFEESNFLIKESDKSIGLSELNDKTLKTIGAKNLSKLIVELYEGYSQNAGKPNSREREIFINNNELLDENYSKKFISDNQSWIQSQNESNLQNILRSAEIPVFASIATYMARDFLLDKVTEYNKNFELVEFLNFQEERNDIFKGFLQKENQSLTQAEKGEVEKEKLLKFDLKQKTDKDNEYLYKVVKAFIANNDEINKVVNKNRDLFKKTKEEFDQKLKNIFTSIENKPNEKAKLNNIVNSDEVGYISCFKEYFMIKVISDTIADEDQKNNFLKNIDAILESIEIQIRNKIRESLESNDENSEEESDASQEESIEDADGSLEDDAEESADENDEGEESIEDAESGTEDAEKESDDENDEGEVENESNEDASSEQINLVNDIVEENGEELSVQELEGIKNNLDKISEEAKTDKKKEIEELKVKLDKLIEDAKERETKVKSVQDLTESEKSNRKNALTIILQDVNRTIKSSKDENYKKEYEKELKLAKEKDLEDENATLVTGFTVGSVLSLALGLGVATAAAPVSGAVALSALAAGFVGMSPVGMAGAFLAKGRKGKETAASQVQPAQSYSADVAKDVEKLEKCVEVLVRQALRETKLIYKKGLRFLLEDIDDAESRRSKIKRYDQLEITKQDIKDTFVAEGFDFFIKNKKFLEKDQFEEFIDRLASIFKVYHNIKVKDAVERDIAQETIASRKEEISIAARQLFNYIEANKQKIEQNFGQEASAQVEKLVSSATNKNVIANLPAPRLALQYSPETWAEEGIQGQGPYATVDPSDSEDDNWDSSSFDSLKSYDTEDTESSDEESSKETELNNSAFSGDFDEVDAEEESEESQQTTYENVDALASDIVKEVKNIQKQTNDAKDSIGKIYLSRDNNKAIVIYREKPKKDSDGFAAPIKIALIDKDISTNKESDHALIKRGYAIYNQGVAGYNNVQIKRALNTLKNLNGKSPNQNRDYFKNTFVKKPNKFEQKTLKNIKFINSDNYTIEPLINSIDFKEKKYESFVRFRVDSQSLSSLLFE